MPDARPNQSLIEAGERRQLTIAFIDLVGSTEASQRLDPEEYRELLDAYHAACADAVAGLGGHVAQYLGDGVLAYFGYPQATEDAASRAIRAALAAVDAVGRLGATAHGPLAARAGIATGVTLIGAPVGGAGGQRLAVGGETPNLAARLQGVAPPGGVAISDATLRLVGAEFHVQPLGNVDLKGIVGPRAIYRVIGPSNVSRFEARATIPSAIVGREAELGLLQHLWGLVRGGDGQVVLLSGDPGIGKSLLARVFVDASGAAAALYQCSPYHTNSALHPLTQQLRSRLGPADTPSLEALQSFLDERGIGDADALAHLAALFSVAAPDAEAIADQLPQKRRDRTAELLVAILIAEAGSGPAAILFEDVHWADATTRDVVARLAEKVGRSRVLLILTFRPDFAPALSGRHVTPVRIAQLRPSESELVAKRIAGDALDDDAIQHIVTRTDGVPLFIEELTRTALEATTTGLEGGSLAVSLPTTLKDSLAARLDRLGPTRELIQIGAAIGRTFSVRLLRAVATIDADHLNAALAGMEGSELVEGVATGQEPSFTFRHALIQDAAYDGMMKSVRRRLHERIAEVIVAIDPLAAKREPELLARHLTLADRGGEAVPFWIAAGDTALRRSALVEAVAHFYAALQVIVKLPASNDRDALELEARAGLGGAAIAQKGWASDEVRRAVGPAKRLAAGSADTRLLVTNMFQIWVNHHTRCEFGRALEVADELVALGTQRDDPRLLAHGFGMAAQTTYFTGKFRDALDLMDRCIATADHTRDHSIVVNTNHEVRSSSEARVGAAHWMLGRPDRAAESTHQTIAVARAAGHAFNLAFVLAIASHAPFLRGDIAGGAAQVDEAVAIAANQRLASLQRMTLPLYEGRKLMHLGRFTDGLAVASAALVALRERSRQLTTVPSNLALLGSLLVGSGDVAGGLGKVEDGIGLAHETGELFELAELWRIKGEMLRVADRPADGEAALLRALAIARSQDARGWELRAATSLARLRADSGLRVEALSAVKPVLEHFDQGLATRDLVEARRMVEQLTTGAGQ